LGYVFCYTNQIIPALAAKFDWDERETTINESIIGSCATITLMIAAAFTGRWIKHGRRRWLLISAGIGSLGAGLSMI
jgi:MFS family permease